MQAAPCDVLLAPGVTRTGASHASDVGSSDAGDCTTARSPMLVDDDATNGGHGDVATHAADRRGVTPTTLHLLLKSERKQEKREQHKQMNNAMHITGGHQ
jgi:hypothetical protein